jgi:hypothetical protein
MAVDDHAIDSLRTWFDIEYEQLKEEWKSNEYENLSDCPSFKGAKAYREAMNILIKACYLPEYFEAHKIQTLKQMIDEELEIEEFWESRK